MLEMALLFIRELNWRLKLAWELQNLQIFSTTCFVWLFHEHLYILHQIWCSSGLTSWFAPYLWTVEKLAHGVLILLAHMQGLFKMSLIQLLGPKCQHSRLIFCDFQTLIFNIQYEKLGEELLWAYFLFHSCWLVQSGVTREEFWD